MKLKLWFLETRPQFLLLTVVLAFLGTCMAWYDHAFHLGYAFLAFFGLLLCHISVNVFNEYFDYRSGIDLRTKRTPFSGGSGILPARLLNPRHVFWFGAISFLLAPASIAFLNMVFRHGWQFALNAAPAAMSHLIFSSMMILPSHFFYFLNGSRKLYKISLPTTSQRAGENHIESQRNSCSRTNSCRPQESRLIHP